MRSFYYVHSAGNGRPSPRTGRSRDLQTLSTKPQPEKTPTSTRNAEQFSSPYLALVPNTAKLALLSAVLNRGELFFAVRQRC
jgi:hypothetical protein